MVINDREFLIRAVRVLSPCGLRLTWVQSVREEEVRGVTPTATSMTAAPGGQQQQQQHPPGVPFQIPPRPWTIRCGG